MLGINKEKQEISLGMKQTQENPWDQVADRYPPGSVVKGTVRNLTNYGAFIEIEEGIDGLLHVSDMSWTRKISHPNEMVEKGQEIECRVLSVDQDRRRIALGLKQMTEDPWATDIPGKYQPGQIVKGPVTKITNFGVFVGLENGLEGLLHISELADHKVENPEEVVKVGEVIEVKVLAGRPRRAQDRPVAQAGGMGRRGGSRGRPKPRRRRAARRDVPSRRTQGRRRRRQRPAVQTRNRRAGRPSSRLRGATGRIGRTGSASNVSQLSAPRDCPDCRGSKLRTAFRGARPAVRCHATSEERETSIRGSCTATLGIGGHARFSPRRRFLRHIPNAATFAPVRRVAAQLQKPRSRVDSCV